MLAGEKVSLYGLVLVPRRTVNYGPINPATSRELFIHHALVEGEYSIYHPFLKHNLALVADIKKLEAKTRRRDLLADQRARFGYYAHRLPHDIFDGRSFELWFREAKRENKNVLFMTQEDLLAAAAGRPRAMRSPISSNSPGANSAALRIPLRHRLAVRWDHHHRTG